MIQVYQVQAVERKSTTLYALPSLSAKVGKTVAIEGEVAQIKQTSGPTIFTIVDESGTQNVAAFIEAGVRAFPEVELDNIVKVIGEVMMRNNQLQIEADPDHCSSRMKMQTKVRDSDRKSTGCPCRTRKYSPAREKRCVGKTPP